MEFVLTNFFYSNSRILIVRLVKLIGAAERLAADSKRMEHYDFLD
jgi:hypothetical protein